VAGDETLVEQQFSVDGTQPAFSFPQKYIIMSDHATVVRYRTHSVSFG